MDTEKFIETLSDNASHTVRLIKVKDCGFAFDVNDKQKLMKDGSPLFNLEVLGEKKKIAGKLKEQSEPLDSEISLEPGTYLVELHDWHMAGMYTDKKTGKETYTKDVKNIQRVKSVLATISGNATPPIKK